MFSIGNNGAPSVSGLLLGGGVGPYYNKVGYSSDTVMNYEVSSLFAKAVCIYS
jgi:hypothetical protein